MLRIYRMGLVVATFFLLIGATIYHVVGLNGVEKQKSDIENRNDRFYNITIYKFKNGAIEKVVKEVSYKEAEEIKRQFSLVDRSQDNYLEKTLKKLNVLIQYGILSGDDIGWRNGSLPPHLSSKTRCAEKPFIYGVMGLILGICELSSDVYFNFGMWVFSICPFIVYGHGNGTVGYLELPDSPLPSEYYVLNFNEWVFAASFTLVGIFLFIPFASPAGLFAGFTIFTMVAGE